MPPLDQEIDNSDNKWQTHDGQTLLLIIMNNKFLEPELEMSPYSDIEEEKMGLILHKGNTGKCRFIK